MRIESVERETRSYYLTVGDDPKGRGLLAIITLGSPQRGDKEVDVCDLEIVPNMKAARRWYREQMKTRPWERIAQTIEVPKELGPITDVKAQGGKLVVITASGAPMIVPVKPPNG